MSVPNRDAGSADSSDPIERLAGLLDEAERVHGAVSASRNFIDAEWPLFYAWWLLTWSDFAEALGGKTRSVLVHDLVRFDREFRAAQPPEAWAHFYARRMLETAGEE